MNQPLIHLFKAQTFRKTSYCGLKILWASTTSTLTIIRQTQCLEPCPFCQYFSCIFRFLGKFFPRSLAKKCQTIKIFQHHDKANKIPSTGNPSKKSTWGKFKKLCKNWFPFKKLRPLTNKPWPVTINQTNIYWIDWKYSKLSKLSTGINSSILFFPMKLNFFEGNVTSYNNSINR